MPFRQRKLQQLYHTSTTLQQEKERFNDVKLSSTYRKSKKYDYITHDPFANMESYVDYQERIELLKSTIIPSKNKTYYSKKQSSGGQTNDDDDDDDDGFTSSASTISSGSSTSGNDDIILSRLDSLSPQEKDVNNDMNGNDDVAKQDKIRFLAFVCNRTSWGSCRGMDLALDMVENSGSLFWYNGFSRTIGDGRNGS